MSENQEIIKKIMGRPKVHEQGSKQWEKDSKYHQAYYHKTNQPTNCPKCGKKTTLRSIVRHQESMKCKFISGDQSVELTL